MQAAFLRLAPRYNSPGTRPRRWHNVLLLSSGPSILPCAQKLQRTIGTSTFGQHTLLRRYARFRSTKPPTARAPRSALDHRAPRSWRRNVRISCGRSVTVAPGTPMACIRVRVRSSASTSCRSVNMSSGTSTGCRHARASRACDRALAAALGAGRTHPNGGTGETGPGTAMGGRPLQTGGRGARRRRPSVRRGGSPTPGARSPAEPP